MTPTPRSVLWKSGALALVLLAVYNAFGYLLEHVEIVPVNPWFIGPFILLLVSIAVMPLFRRHWWESNYAVVSYGLGMVVVVYYVIFIGNGQRVFLSSYEYISFISLIGSLFVVSGGIHVRIRGKASPWENLGLLTTGAVVSNLLGTTGASMILIRPYLRLNKYRIKPYHIVFFIFIVSNIGGALTPIGDPPLFLGYLKGIPFFWIISRVSHIWALTLGLVLLAFFVVDSYYFRKESGKTRHAAMASDEPEVSGLHNIVFLFVIIGAVFIDRPLMLREVIMWGAAVASYFTTNKEIHRKNEFNFLPIKEVAILFAGIFATMIPALDWLELNAGKLGVVSVGQYFWGTGILSSILDNAPTYLNFLSAAFGLHGASVENVAHVRAMIDLGTPEALGLTNPLVAGAMTITADTWRYVQAVSLGAVFFGACTYIGNGPNFMVKSIAEQAGVACPSFFGYVVRYTIPVLLPVFIVVWLLFFRS
ncbi:MAG: sodium:proton antiporter [Bacteroidota bacterium]